PSCTGARKRIGGKMTLSAPATRTAPASRRLNSELQVVRVATTSPVASTGLSDAVTGCTFSAAYAARIGDPSPRTDLMMYAPQPPPEPRADKEASAPARTMPAAAAPTTM